MQEYGGVSGILRVASRSACCLFVALSMIMGISYSVHAVSTGDILTMAGGALGDGGVATSASFIDPLGLTVDSAGNLYIADSNNHRIRKVAADTGIITTVAGNGNMGFAGDGGIATEARLFRPSGVIVDSAGNLFIADTYNHRIRKVAADTGIITTVSGNGTDVFAGDGGPATSASLNTPSEVTVDSVGNLYIADTYNHRIRKVAANTGIITTLSGNGIGVFAGDGGPATSASLNAPFGVTVDSAGNLYIADTYNHRIRKVAANTGVITTVAGNGTGMFAGDGGPAFSASLNYPQGVTIDSAGNLYVADTCNHSIRKVAANTGIIITVAGNGNMGFAGDGGPATSASLNAPFGVAVDSAGNLYIDDSGNDCIRKVTTETGVITTVAGNNTGTFGGDGGPATSASLNAPFGVTVDSSGNLYIADYLNNRIRKVAVGTGVITTVAGNGIHAFAGDGGPATSASLNYPQGVTIDSVGNMFIADTYNHRIRKVAANTGIITTVAGNGTCAFAGDGGPATSASLNYPQGVTIDNAGNMFIADSHNHRIRKVAANTEIITTMAGNGLQTPGFVGDGGSATSASLNYPSNVTVDIAGNLYVADTFNHRIRKVAAGTGIITTVAGNGSYDFTGDGGPATSASFKHLQCVTVDIAGNLFIADAYNHRIRKVAAVTAIITTVAGIGDGNFSGDGSTAISASLQYPNGVTVDSTGNLYIADTGNNRIRKVIMQGVTLPAASTGAASAVSATSATLNGTVNDNFANTIVTFEYGLTTSYGKNISVCTVTAGSGITAASASISGLVCGSTYHFRVFAVNSAGTTNGSDQTFTTAGCVINGVCGTSNGSLFTVAPTSNLCASGAPTAVSGAGPWSWTCSGSKGGSTSSCSASLQASTGTASMIGDINGDDKVDINDVLKVLRIAVGLETATADNFAKADAAPLKDGKPAPDGVIDISDALVILKKVVGLVNW